MMNFYDLNNLATPDPLIVSKVFGIGQTLATSDDSVPVCFCDITGQPNKHNALLLAHCRNNFLKALEALKRDARLFNCIADSENSGLASDRFDELQSLIKELEEVKE